MKTEGTSTIDQEQDGHEAVSETDFSEQEEGGARRPLETITNRNGSDRKKKLVVIGIIATVIVIIAIVIPLAILLPSDKDEEPFWNETRNWPVEDDVFSDTMLPNQVYLTNDGERSFVSKGEDMFRTTLIHIYDYNGTFWNLHSELAVGAEIPDDGIDYIVPSLDGTRLAVSYSNNVTVYQDETGNTTNSSTSSWVPVGMALTPLLLANESVDAAVNASSIYNFGRSAMALSKDGRLLTIYASLALPPYVDRSPENQPGLIAAFREEAGKWRLMDQHKELLNFGVDEHPFNPFISPSGEALALRLLGESGQYDRKEVVSLYTYSLATKWSLRETFVEPLAGADAPPNSFFGSAIAMSYDGSVCAIGALNYKTGEGRYGLVKVHEKYATEGYRQKGKALEPGSDTYRFGEHVALSSEGDRLAVYFTHNGQPHVQVFEFNDDNDEWTTLGKSITQENRDRVECLSLSSDGSWVAMTWDCQPREMYCLSVYELVDG